MPPYTIGEYLLIIALLTAGVVLSIIARKLTLPAAITGGLIGMVLFTGTGYMGLLLLAVFFLSGTLATRFRKEEKTGLQTAGDNSEQRTTGQVLANGGAAALWAALALADKAHGQIYHAMAAGSLAAATSDTLSSELGMVYGRRFFNILSFRREARGLDGVISIEGTLIGIAGAFGIALLYACFAGWDRAVLFITIGGFMGNLLDSVLGAALERSRYLGNDAVNFINTVFAGIVVCLLTLCL